jgi:hypothetical protein
VKCWPAATSTMSDHSGGPCDGPFHSGTVPRICDTKIKDKWVVLAIEVTAGLPKLKSTRAVCALPKKCPSIGNRFSVVPRRKFGAPDELAVTIEKVTAVFDRACCPQRNLVRN